MSTESYQTWWIKARGELEEVKDFDQNIQKLNNKPITDKELATKLVSGLYARYCMIVQEVSACLDQMGQIQKSMTVRKLMDAAATRLNELKDELLKIDISEYHYIDGELIELKLIPHSIEILHPDLVFPRAPELQDFLNRIKAGEKIYIPPPPPEIVEAEAPPPPEDPLAALLGGAKPKKEVKIAEKKVEEKKEEVKEEVVEPPPEDKGSENRVKTPEERRAERKKKAKPKKGYVIEVVELTAAEIEAQKQKEKVLAAVKIIQANERARQARLYYCDLNMECMARQSAALPGAKKPIVYEPGVLDACAITIQRHWRGYRDRKMVARKEIQRRLVIGMVEPSYVCYDEAEKFERNLEKRRAMRDQHIKDYIQAHLDEKARVLRVVGPGLFEDIGDEIRWWFYEWYTVARALQPIPSEEQGGSVLIVRGDVITIEEYLDAKKKKSKEKPKSKEQLKKEKDAEKAKKKKEKDLAKKAKAQAKLKAKRAGFEVDLAKTKMTPLYEEGAKEFKDIWDHIDDAENPDEKTYMYMITEEKCHEMQLEIRAQVDEMMRIELEMLQDAFDRDKWNAANKKGKFKAKKHGKKGKKKGKKGKKDPTGNRCTEDLFQELVDNNIIIQYPQTYRIRDFKGDFSYQNWEKRQLQYDPPPTLGDVRQAVVLNCINPLGAQYMDKPKSVLIVGHRQSGKHLLANAIFNETKCVLFDLSPPNLVGKYTGGKATKMLVHLINKMARLLQPSIIFVDGAEKHFYSKVPKEEKEFEPKRAGKFIWSKIGKTLKPEDRVLILGITNKPWEAQFGGMKKTYQRVILIPRTDYGSVYLYWRELLMPYHGIDRNLDVSALVQLTVRYPLSELKEAVKEVLTPCRVIQLSYNPLQQSEMLDYLIKGPGPVEDQEWSKYEKFYYKLPLGKERMKMNIAQQKMREKMGGAKGAKK